MDLQSPGYDPLRCAVGSCLRAESAHVVRVPEGTHGGYQTGFVEAHYVNDLYNLLTLGQGDAYVEGHGSAVALSTSNRSGQVQYGVALDCPLVELADGGVSPLRRLADRILDAGIWSVERDNA